MITQVKYQAQRCLKTSSQLFIVFVIAVASSRSGFAQVRHYRSSLRQRDSYQGFYFLSDFEFNGLPYNYSFQNGGKILNRGWAFNDGTTDGGIGLAFRLGVHYRLSNRFALETGIQFNEMDLVVNDKRFLTNMGVKGTALYPDNNFSGTESNYGNFDATNWYRSHYLSAYYLMPGNSPLNFYFCGGLAINYLTGPINMTGTYHSQSTNETLQLTTHYKPIYLNSYIESGICFYSNHEVYIAGLRYYFARDLLFGDYSDTQNGNVVYTDQVNSSGSYLSVSLKIGLKGPGNSTRPKNSHHRSKKHKAAKKSHPKIKSHSNKRMIPFKDESNTRGF